MQEKVMEKLFKEYGDALTGCQKVLNEIMGAAVDGREESDAFTRQYNHHASKAGDALTESMHWVGDIVGLAQNEEQLKGALNGNSED